MKLLRGLTTVCAALVLSTGTTGCLRKVLIDGQVRGTRTGSAAVNTLHDFEIARAVGEAGLGQLEGMHQLAPYNEDALFLLTRSWSGAAFAFTEDDYEVALIQGDDRAAAYHQERARAGYSRAIFYGLELLGARAPGFEDARKDEMTMRAWLERYFNDPSEAEELLWVGYAWVSRVGVSRDMPDMVGELFVGVEFVRRSLELNDSIEYGTGYTIMGAYHARTAQSELEESKQAFDKAMKVNGGKFLPTVLNYATRYYCAKADQATYRKLLQQIIDAPDDLPEARLQNVIAKRRARRYLDYNIFEEDCGFAGAAG